VFEENLVILTASGFVPFHFMRLEYLIIFTIFGFSGSVKKSKICTLDYMVGTKLSSVIRFGSVA